MTVHDAIQRTGLDVQRFQREFLRAAFSPEVSVAALSTPRGAGKTELLGRIGGLAVVEGSPVFRPGHECVIFAGSMRQARHLFRAAKRALPDPDAYRTRDNNQEIAILGPQDTKLVVRHVIIFGYGHGLQRAIIDESQHRTPERLIMAQH